MSKKLKNFDIKIQYIDSTNIEENYTLSKFKSKCEIKFNKWNRFESIGIDTK